MADDSGIDPRHPAQFQRGFDPAVHPPAVSPSPSPRAAEPKRLPGGPLPTAERVAPPPQLEERPTPGVPAPAVAHDEEPFEQVTLDRQAVLLERALLIAGGVLLLVAGWLFWEAAGDRTMFTGYRDPSELALAQVRNTLPGPFLVAAVIAVTSWVMLRALRRPSDER